MWSYIAFNFCLAILASGELGYLSIKVLKKKPAKIVKAVKWILVTLTNAYKWFVLGLPILPPRIIAEEPYPGLVDYLFRKTRSLLLPNVKQKYD